jgi:hypothetical protein
MKELRVEKYEVAPGLFIGSATKMRFVKSNTSKTNAWNY